MQHLHHQGRGLMLVNGLNQSGRQNQLALLCQSQPPHLTPFAMARRMAGETALGAVALLWMH